MSIKPKLRDFFKKKHIDEDKKDVELEKGDFLAIMIALSYYMVPALIGILAFFALLIWIIFF